MSKERVEANSRASLGKDKRNEASYENRDEVPTAAKGKTQWDSIPITYIELLSKFIDSGFIEDRKSVV